MENPFEIIVERLDRIEKLLENNREYLNKSEIKYTRQTLMTIKDVASYLNLSVPTIYGYTAKRHIPHSKRGNRLYFDKTAINDWIAKGQQNTISEIGNMASENLVKNK